MQKVYIPTIALIGNLYKNLTSAYIFPLIFNSFFIYTYVCNNIYGVWAANPIIR